MKDQNKLGLSSQESAFLKEALRNKYEDLAARSWTTPKCQSIINIAHKAGLYQLERRLTSNLKFDLSSISNKPWIIN